MFIIKGWAQKKGKSHRSDALIRHSYVVRSKFGTIRTEYDSCFTHCTSCYYLFMYFAYMLVRSLNLVEQRLLYTELERTVSTVCSNGTCIVHVHILNALLYTLPFPAWCSLIHIWRDAFEARGTVKVSLIYILMFCIGRAIGGFFGIG